MAKLSRGKSKTIRLAPKGIPTRMSNGFAQSATTRVGKQSKFGVKKAKAPGATWNMPKKLGG